jgi:hypothetical protein
MSIAHPAAKGSKRTAPLRRQVRSALAETSESIRWLGGYAA